MMYILIALAIAIIVSLFLPDKPSCRKHGKDAMYQHGYYDEWDCEKCRIINPKE